MPTLAVIGAGPTMVMPAALAERLAARASSAAFPSATCWAEYAEEGLRRDGPGPA